MRLGEPIKLRFLTFGQGRGDALRVAPEILDTGDHAAFTPACDVWAVCVVVWELLCGPFTGEPSPLAFPSTVPRAVMQVVLDGVSDVPGRRPTARELLRALETADADHDVGAAREAFIVSRPVFEQVVARVGVRIDEGEGEEENE